MYYKLFPRLRILKIFFKILYEDYELKLAAVVSSLAVGHRAHPSGMEAISPDLAAALAAANATAEQVRQSLCTVCPLPSWPRTLPCVLLFSKLNPFLAVPQAVADVEAWRRNSLPAAAPHQVTTAKSRGEMQLGSRIRARPGSPARGHCRRCPSPHWPPSTPPLSLSHTHTPNYTHSLYARC